MESKHTCRKVDRPRKCHDPLQLQSMYMIWLGTYTGVAFTQYTGLQIPMAAPVSTHIIHYYLQQREHALQPILHCGSLSVIGSKHGSDLTSYAMFYIGSGPDLTLWFIPGRQCQWAGFTVYCLKSGLALIWPQQTSLIGPGPDSACWAPICSYQCRFICLTQTL